MGQEVKILTPLQEDFLDLFFQTNVSDYFRLSAGTALAAFYLYHRLSDDLDFFTLKRDLNLHKVNAEGALIAEKLNLETTKHVSTPEYVQLIYTQSPTKSLKVDFVRELPPQFGKPQVVSGVTVDSLQNIAVNKLLSLYGRFDAKDFVDVYFLVKEENLDFQKLVQQAKEKYPGFSEFYLASNIADIRYLKNYPRVLKEFDRDDLVFFYESLSENIFERIKPEE